MNITQKCKAQSEECTETKECCGVDIQCAQWGDSKLKKMSIFYRDNIWLGVAYRSSLLNLIV